MGWTVETLNAVVRSLVASRHPGAVCAGLRADRPSPYRVGAPHVTSRERFGKCVCVARMGLRGRCSTVRDRQSRGASFRKKAEDAAPGDQAIRRQGGIATSSMTCTAKSRTRLPRAFEHLGPEFVGPRARGANQRRAHAGSTRRAHADDAIGLARLESGRVRRTLEKIARCTGTRLGSASSPSGPRPEGNPSGRLDVGSGKVLALE